MMSTYINGVEDGGPETAFLSHKARVPDYLWVAEVGVHTVELKMLGLSCHLSNRAANSKAE